MMAMVDSINAVRAISIASDNFVEKVKKMSDNQINLTYADVNNCQREALDYLSKCEKKDGDYKDMICPYCGSVMILKFDDTKRYGTSAVRLSYKCEYCGSRSPDVVVRISMFDEREVQRDINRNIEAAKQEIARENGDEEEDEIND